MQAIIFPQAETISFERVPDPTCAPDEVIVHCEEVPYGVYWDLIRPQVTLHRVTRLRR